MDDKLRFYFDENVEVEIARQLRLRHIDVVTTVELGLLKATDEYHLMNATQMGYVLCTYDSDYLKLASSGINHTGIIFGRWSKHTIGDWVNKCTFLHETLLAHDMHNRIAFL